MTKFTLEKNFSNVGEIVRGSLGQRDAKGREIGYIVWTANVVWSAKEHQYGPFTPEQAAQDEVEARNTRPFALRIQATRNGVGYGATQPIRYFAHSALRDAAIIAYVADAKKRAAKKFL